MADKEPNYVTRNISLDLETDGMVEAVKVHLPYPNYSAAIRFIVRDREELIKIADKLQKQVEQIQQPLTSTIQKKKAAAAA